MLAELRAKWWKKKHNIKQESWMKNSSTQSHHSYNKKAVLDIILYIYIELLSYRRRVFMVHTGNVIFDFFFLLSLSQRNELMCNGLAIFGSKMIPPSPCAHIIKWFYERWTWASHLYTHLYITHTHIHTHLAWHISSRRHFHFLYWFPIYGISMMRNPEMKSTTPPHQCWFRTPKNTQNIHIKPPHRQQWWWWYVVIW
jgi:hypothetical protein